MENQLDGQCCRRRSGIPLNDNIFFIENKTFLSAMGLSMVYFVFYRCWKTCMPILKNILQLLILVIVVSAQTWCFGMENIFYVLRNNPSKTQSPLLTTLSAHQNQIHLLITQAYRVTGDGVIKGYVNPDLFKFAQAHSIKLIVLLTNANFDKKIAHQFLTSPVAIQRALKSLLTLCQQNHFYGVQFDFESVALTDKSALTHFYQSGAELLHKNHFVVSFAVAPTVSDGPFQTAFQKRMYENWSGAYDLKALSHSADFITLMAYDQHVGKVTPGPVASIRWVNELLKHTLQFIPPEKLSLGIPVYSGFWYTGTSQLSPNSISIQNNAIEYSLVQHLINKYHLHLLWDDRDKVNYTFYDYAWLNKYIFIEDARSFKEKLALAKKYHLRGITVFRIGAEDPHIWNVLS